MNDQILFYWFQTIIGDKITELWPYSEVHKTDKRNQMEKFQYNMLNQERRLHPKGSHEEIMNRRGWSGTWISEKTLPDLQNRRVQGMIHSCCVKTILKKGHYPLSLVLLKFSVGLRTDLTRELLYWRSNHTSGNFCLKTTFNLASKVFSQTIFPSCEAKTTPPELLKC